MIPKTDVFLRADGDGQVGLGHVHRLIALSEILGDSFNCKFVIRNPLKGIRELISKTAEVVEVTSSSVTDVTHLLTGREIVVLDGYNFTTSYQQQIKELGSVLVSIDDIYSTHFVSDVIINPAGGIDEKVYSKEPYTEVFTGPAFSLLKNPFREAAKTKMQRAPRESILICMGGADPNDNTRKVLESEPLRTSSIPIKIIIGEAYPFKNQLKEQVKASGVPAEILQSLSPEEVANTMKQCGVAICSASGIAYEYLSVGGELYVLQTVENQDALYQYLTNTGLAFPFANFRVDKSAAQKSIEVQNRIFTGDPYPLIRIFNRLDFDLNSSIRKANSGDLTTIFEWANEPDLRAQSFNSEPITLESHTQWFTKTLNDAQTVMYVVEYKNTPVAQVRFNLKEDAVVSYSLAKDFRGRGWGEKILKKAIDELSKESKRLLKIIGYVKRGNSNSNNIFKKMGFTQLSTEVYPDSFRYELIVLQ